MWDASPVGAFADVMWAEPSGRRVLYAAETPAAFVTAVYGFDRVVHTAVDATWDGRVLDLAFADPDTGTTTELTFTCGRGVPFPPRPAWVTRWIEAPIARRLLGVETYGTSPTGVQEWYRARRWHRVRSADVRGRPLGALAPVAPRCGFGFSEPPVTPSLTEVRPRLVDRSGRLGQLVRGLVAAVLVLVLGAGLGACGDDGRSDQLELNSVMVDAPQWLSEEDSEAVSAIGLELVALGAPLREWFEGTEARDVLLERMRGAVERIEQRVDGAESPAVGATFRPYVTEWYEILDALEDGDTLRYERAVARVQQLDAQRVARVEDAYGEAEAERLLVEEGVDPSR